MMEKSEMDWEALFRRGLKERAGVYNYCLHPDWSAGFLETVLRCLPVTAEMSGLGLGPFDRHYHPELMRNLDYYMRVGWPGKEVLIRRLLDTLMADSPDSETICALLFRALAAAEIRFVSQYIPQNSHEERLTGHLLSEVVFCLDLVKQNFRSACKRIYDTEVDLDFYYADVASNANESRSGADFAVILLIDLPDAPRVIKAIKFQAKKASPAARVNVLQRRALASEDDSGAFYVFYKMLVPQQREIGIISPLVLSAAECKSHASDPEGFDDLPESRQRKIEVTVSRDEVTRNTVPFSAFLMLDVLDPDSPTGRVCESLREAASYIYGTNVPDFDVSRVLVISVGAGPVPVAPAGGEGGPEGGIFRFPHGKLIE